ncbi:MAG: N-acetylneuraminate synthase family protein [Porticoccaceae bacterium]|nr:N-acetylneuraminate synthase family protein [Porticoccaceae bacterium]
MTKFIAEVSSNHNRDLARCFEFIDAAARIGCDAVKFQLFKIDQLFAPQILAKSETHRKRKDWELPTAFLPKLAQRSREQGIQFSCTPFYLDAVSELEPYVDFYKIASYELLWDDLILACARTGKPLILSTGMATLHEIQHAVTLARDVGCKNLTLLHCISGYPAPPQECNLAAIDTLRVACDCPVGWSDHSVSHAVVQRAVQHWGAVVVELHLDLEGEGEEFATGHCWLPAQIHDVIEAIKVGCSADGNGEKQPALSELSDRDWRADPSDGLRPLKRVRSDWEP